MLYLPFNDPEACYKTVLEFADRKGVIGFMVTATHYRGVYDNAYAKTYAALQERSLPLAFHAAFNWADSGLSMTNRFIAVHALGFCLAQHAAPDQLGRERHAGALPAAQDRSGSRAGSPGSRS